MPTLSIGDCIRFGWETFKQRPWFLIGTCFLAMLITSIPGLFQPTPEFAPDGTLIEHPLTVYDGIVGLISVAVSIFVAIGLVTFSLRAHDNIQGAQVSDLWNPGPFWRFLGAHILTGIAVGLGFVAFIVPGVILAAGLAFVPYLVIERGLGPIEAIKESWRITKGHKWPLFLLMLSLAGICLLGLLALVVGVFVALPIVLLAFAHAYRTLAT
ncbi:MAG: DUF975 family protein [Hyphomicrobium sp.]|jgi:membrane-anchored glycerophosphoryl diester phosphodiesterase (GDPDase)